MSKEIKYKPIYGLQKPFDDGPEDAEAYGFSSVGGKYLFYKIDKTSVYCFDTDNKWSHIDGAPRIPFLAMRRIIKTPVWTKEDQKAGLLPEKGAKYEVDGCVVSHLGNGAAGYQNIFYFEYPSGACGTAHERIAKPIETQEERAQRLRDEWCSECTSKYYPRGHKGFPEMIYDALLSGELQVPTKWK